MNYMPLTNQTLSDDPSFFLPNHVYRFQIFPPDDDIPTDEYNLHSRPYNRPHADTPIIYVEATCRQIMYSNRVRMGCSVNFVNTVIRENDKRYLVRPSSVRHPIQFSVTNYAAEGMRYFLWPQPFGEFWTGLTCESRRRIGLIEDLSIGKTLPRIQGRKEKESVKSKRKKTAKKRTFPYRLIKSFRSPQRVALQ